MELPLIIQTVLKSDAEGFLCCTGKTYLNLFKPHHQKQASKTFENILNGLGGLSAKAQALKQEITSSIKFIGSDHRIYIKIKDNKALGFIKVGQKNLFYRDFIGNIKQLKPTCVLDIYVHESCQRSGIGKEIFQKFLRTQAKTPDRLAYDRPSQKLLGFLKKHYGLVKYIAQNNNYVIYDRFFSKEVSSVNLSSKNKEVITTPPSIIEVNSQSKIRPKSYLPLPNQKIEQNKKQTLELQQKKFTQKSQTKRQFQQFHTTQQQNLNKTAKHKNTTSQGFPLSVQQIKSSTNVNPMMRMDRNENNNSNLNNSINNVTGSNIKLSQNPTFRTTSNTYGNYYKRRN